MTFLFHAGSLSCAFAFPLAQSANAANAQSVRAIAAGTNELGTVSPSPASGPVEIHRDPVLPTAASGSR